MNTNTTRRAALTGASIATLISIPTVAAARRLPAPVAELIALGKLLDETWAIWRRELAAAEADLDQLHDAYRAADAASESCSTIVEWIETLPATTLAGLSVKQRAVAWYWFGEPPTAEELAGYGPTADFRIIAGILADLSKLEGSGA